MTCIFCEIIEYKSPANIVFENEKIIAFNDIKPASKYHYLIIPKTHYNNVSMLNNSHYELVQEMVEKAEHLLINEHKINANDIRLGFHWPPFNTINHVHLHAIAPVSQMSFLSKLIFRPNSFWFVTAEYLMKRIHK